jgi:hypothetical protein
LPNARALGLGPGFSVWTGESVTDDEIRALGEAIRERGIARVA